MPSSDHAKEKAPDAAATAVERIDPTPKGEITMETTTVHPEIEAIFAQIDQLPEGHLLLLDEHDFGFRDVGDVWTRPMTDITVDLDTLKADAENQQPHLFGIWFDAAGTRIPLAHRDEAWMEAEFDQIPRDGRATRNAAFRSPGGFLFVSLGIWYADSEATIDGAPAFTFVTERELLRRWQAAHEAAKEQFLELAAVELELHRPGWEERVDAYDVESDEPEVIYEATVGNVRITRVDRVLPEWVQGTPTIDVLSSDSLSADDAQKLAADLRTAASMLKLAEAGMLGGAR